LTSDDTIRPSDFEGPRAAFGRTRNGADESDR
jgi:hypothetical protein